jgi:hypothetical protein
MLILFFFLQVSPFSFGSSELVPMDEVAVAKSLQEHEAGSKDDLRENEPEADAGVLDRTDG